MKKTEVVQIRLTTNQKARIKELADYRGITITDLILNTMSEQLFEYGNDFTIEDYELFKR